MKKNSAVHRDVQRPKHEHSPYNDSGTTWGRPQGGKTAGTRHGAVTGNTNVTKSAPKSAGSGAREVISSGVKTVKGLVG